jgi:hypothetical protein
METEGKRALRLIEALEVLVSQEEIGVRTGAGCLAQIQRRAAPIVEDLAKMAAIPSVAILRPRVLALVERRQLALGAMTERVDRIKLRLASLSDSMSHLKRVAPAYGKTVRGPVRLAQSV